MAQSGGTAEVGQAVDAVTETQPATSSAAPWRQPTIERCPICAREDRAHIDRALTHCVSRCASSFVSTIARWQQAVTGATTIG
jgi:hypothetical protein